MKYSFVLSVYLSVCLSLSLCLCLSLSTLPSPLCSRFIWFESSLLPHELLLDFHVVVGDKGRGISTTCITIQTPRSCLKVIAGSHSKRSWDLNNKEKTKRCEQNARFTGLTLIPLW